MGAYDNPQQIKTRADQAAKGIQSFYQSLNATADGIQKQAELRRKRAKEALREKKLEEKEAKQEKITKDAFERSTFGGVDKEAANLKEQAQNFERQAGKKVFQEDAIGDTLFLLRQNMDDEIAAAGGQDASLRVIDQIRNKYLAKVGTFKKDIENFTAGYRIYKEAKNIPQGQQGAIMDNFAPGMIDIYESLDKQKGNIYIGEDASGGFSVTAFDMESSDDQGNPLVVDTLSLTKYRQDVADNDQQFFNTVVTDSIKDRSDHLQVAINNFGDKYGFNTTIKEPVMTRDSSGKLVQATKLVYGKPQLSFTNIPVVDQQKFDQFLESTDGEKWLRDYYIETGDDGKSSYIYEPESLYAGFTDQQKTGGQDIGVGYYTPENFNSTLKNIFRSQISQ
jgi:hypothetical protein